MGRPALPPASGRACIPARRVSVSSAATEAFSGEIAQNGVSSRRGATLQPCNERTYL